MEDKKWKYHLTASNILQPLQEARIEALRVATFHLI
jgi:hypothetical protein